MQVPAESSFAQGAAPDDALRDLGEVSAEILHELRNELQGITVAAYAARLAAPSAEIERTLMHAAQAQYVVEDLLLLLRATPLPVTSCNFHVLYTEACAPFGNLARFEIEAAADAELAVHPRLWVRMLRVLLANAVQCGATHVRCKLTHSAQPGTRAELEIVDNGPGIAAELQAHLFTPLASAREGGTGLGLPLARRIAERHGGALTLSASSAAGSIFQYSTTK